MKRTTLYLIGTGAALLILIGGLYFFIIRPRLAKIEIKPPSVTEPEKPTLPDERHAILNLYFHAPLRLAGISRMELTLTGIEGIGEGGESYTIFEGSRRVTVQEGIVQKVASERIFQGSLERFILTFGPTSKIYSEDRTTQTVFLPKRELAVEVNEEIPLSRTLNSLITLPKNTAFGEKNGVLTLELPASTDSDHALLGSIFQNERSIGEIYSIPNATIRDAIFADIGLDIAPREGPRGSQGFGAPDASAPTPETP